MAFTLHLAMQSKTVYFIREVIVLYEQQYISKNYKAHKMTGTELNQALKHVDIGTLMKDTTIIRVHDTDAHVTYKTNIKTLAKAIAKQLVKDGVIPGGDE